MTNKVKNFFTGFKASSFTPIAIIILVSAVAYANTLRNGFVADDAQVVLNNPWITSFDHLSDIFFSNVWAFAEEGTTLLPGNYYRPMIFIFMVEYRFFGLEPWGWHLVNVIFHVLNSVLVFLVAAGLLKGREQGARSSTVNRDSLYEAKYLLPLVAALFFGVHPINTEAVAWISCIFELSYTMFCLLAFYLYIKASEREVTEQSQGAGSVISGYYYLSALLFFFSLISKETGVILLGLLLAFDYCFRPPSGSGTFRLGSFKRYVPYGAVVIIYLGLRYYALGGIVPDKSDADYASVFQYLISVFPLFTGYLQSFLLPINLTFYHHYNPVFTLAEAQTWYSLLLTASFVLVFLWLFVRKAFLYLFLLVFLVLPLLPVLYLPNTFAERYLYMPSVSFALLLTLGLRGIADRLWPARAPLIFFLAVGFILSAYSYGTVMRTFDWRSEETLSKAALEMDPDNYYALNELGMLYSKTGLTEEAIVTFEKVIPLIRSSSYSDTEMMAFTRLRLADEYRKKNMFDDAINQYKEVLKVWPGYTSIRLTLAVTYQQSGLLNEAIAAYSKVLEMSRDTSEILDAYNNLGACYAQKGLFDEAIKMFEQALAISPMSEDIRRNLMKVRKLAEKKD